MICNYFIWNIPCADMTVTCAFPCRLIVINDITGLRLSSVANLECCIVFFFRSFFGMAFSVGMLFLINGFVYVLSTLAMMCAIIYAILPFVIKFFPSIAAQGTFLNLVCAPRRVSCLHRPKEAWKLNGVKNHYISNNQNGSKLGVWHLSPTNVMYDNVETENEISLAVAKKIIIYCHGNAGHRCFGHRRCLYAVLRNLGFHVVTFDYRGYGDSDGWPSEEGVIDDTVMIYKWVVEQAIHPDCEIMVWGHSLGTAIATQAMLRIQAGEFARLPSGIVLEAPFTSIAEAMKEYPLTKYLVMLYPGNWLEKLMHRALSAVCISFLTVNALPQLSSNILILHAKDDRHIDFKLGKKLYEETKQRENIFVKNVTFAAFEARHGYGHNGIWQNPELPSLIQKLVKGDVEHGFFEIEL